MAQERDDLPPLPKASRPPDDGEIYGGDHQPWSNAVWGWIAGIAVAVLVLVFAFGSGH